MAIIKKNFIKPEFDKIQTLDFNRLYLMVGDKAVKLSDIWINDGDRRVRLSNIYDFEKLKSSDGFVFSHLGERIDLTGSRDASDVERYISENIRFASEVVVPTRFETYEEVSLNVGGSSQPSKGLRRTVSTVEATDMSERGAQENYILVQLLGNSEFEYVKRSEIQHFEGNSSVPSFIGEGSVESQVVDDRQYFVNGHQIFNMYVEKEYRLDTLLSYEELDLEKKERKIFGAVMGEDGSISYDQVEVQKIDDIISEQTPSVDGKLKIRNFRLVANGEFVNVCLQGRTVEEMVKLTDLYDASNRPIVDENGYLMRDLVDYIGESLMIKMQDGSFAQTTPLTSEQAQLTYDSVKAMQETENDADILEEGNYLRTIDGRYVEEQQAVQPICFNFAGDHEAFQAYFVLIGSGDKERYVIIEKSEFEDLSKGKDSFSLEGEIVNVRTAKKLKRANMMTNCDVLQTTNREGKKFNECKHYNKVDSSNVEERAQELEIQRQAFLQAYKSGQYPVHDMVDEKGNVIGLEETRYKLVDEYTIDDPIVKTGEYDGLKEKDVSFVQKDGKLVAVKGGPKYDVGKAWGKKCGNITKFMFEGIARVGATGGFFLIPALPVIIPAFVGGLVGSYAVSAVYCGVKASIVNRAKSRFKDPVEIRRKATSKTFEADMVKLYEETCAHMDKSLTPQQVEASECIFLQNIDQIIQLTMQLSKTIDKSTFEFKDGKCKFDAHNAHTVGEFAAETQIQLDELKSLGEQVKSVKAKKDAFEKAKAKIEARRNQYGDLTEKDKKKLDKLIRSQGGSVSEYEILQQKQKTLQAIVQGKTTDFVSEPTVSAEDTLKEEKLARVKAMKGFIMLKYFNKDNIYGLDEDELELLEMLEFNPTNGCFVDKTSKYEFTLPQILDGQLQRDANSEADIPKTKEALFKLTSDMERVSQQTYDIHNDRFVLRRQRSITRTIGAEDILPDDEKLADEYILGKEDNRPKVIGEDRIIPEPKSSEPEPPKPIIAKVDYIPSPPPKVKMTVVTIPDPKRTEENVDNENQGKDVSEAERRKRDLLTEIEEKQSEIKDKEQEISQTESEIEFLEDVEQYLAKKYKASETANDDMLDVDKQHKDLLARLQFIQEQLKLRPEDASLVRENNDLIAEIEKKAKELEEKIKISNKRFAEQEEAEYNVRNRKAERKPTFDNSEQAKEYLRSKQAEKEQLEQEKERLEQELQQIEDEIKQQLLSQDLKQDLVALEERMRGQEDKLTKLKYLQEGMKKFAKLQDELEKKLKHALTDEERDKILAVLKQVGALADKYRELADMVKKQPDIEPAKKEKDKSKADKKTKSPEEKKDQKTRLSKPALEKLLKQIDKLGELDKLWYSSDDEIPSDINVQLTKLEVAIRPNIHLLKKASKNPNYGIYMSRIITAEGILKQYRFGQRKAVSIADANELKI